VKPKVKNPEKTKVACANTVFIQLEFNTQGADIILVEGIFDAMALWKNNINALALCGKTLSDSNWPLVLCYNQKYRISFRPRLNG